MSKTLRLRLRIKIVVLLIFVFIIFNALSNPSADSFGLFFVINSKKGGQNGYVRTCLFINSCKKPKTSLVSLSNQEC